MGLVTLINFFPISFPIHTHTWTIHATFVNDYPCLTRVVKKSAEIMVFEGQAYSSVYITSKGRTLIILLSFLYQSFPWLVFEFIHSCIHSGMDSIQSIHSGLPKCVASPIRWLLVVVSLFERSCSILQSPQKYPSLNYSHGVKFMNKVWIKKCRSRNQECIQLSNELVYFIWRSQNLYSPKDHLIDCYAILQQCDTELSSVNVNLCTEKNHYTNLSLQYMEKIKIHYSP